MQGHLRQKSKGTLSALWKLTKPHLSFFATLTAGVGYFVCGGRDWAIIVMVLAGTYLVACSGGTLNQFLERESDKHMERTKRRPLPQGNINAALALVFGLGLGVAGCSLLLVTHEPLSSLFAFVALVAYVGIYTPLKPLTNWNTLVGTLPGAAPTLIGATAAKGGQLPWVAYIFFGTLVAWQMPHFLSLSWVCREDYTRAKLKMTATKDPQGKNVAHQSLLWSFAVILITLLPLVSRIYSPIYYGLPMVFINLFLLNKALNFYKYPLKSKREAARELFLGSLVYLPVVSFIFVVNSFISG